MCDCTHVRFRCIHALVGVVSLEHLVEVDLFAELFGDVVLQLVLGVTALLVVALILPFENFFQDIDQEAFTQLHVQVPACMVRGVCCACRRKCWPARRVKPVCSAW